MKIELIIDKPISDWKGLGIWNLELSGNCVYFTIGSGKKEYSRIWHKNKKEYYFLYRGDKIFFKEVLF